MDCAGNLYVTANGGVTVVAPDGGTIGSITVAEKPANVTFGGADRQTLYITAGPTLYMIGLMVPGLP
jgi:gluconolactonase